MKIKIIPKKQIKNFWSKLLNALFPPLCLKCKEICSDAGGICSDCFASIRFVNAPYCDKCGCPVDEVQKEWGFCPCCRKRKKCYFDKARFTVCYDHNISPMILALKYADKTCIVPLFAKWLRNAGKDILPDADMLVPVPLHLFRTLGRKYNQSALLAKELSRISKIPYCPFCLKRVKNSHSQGEFSFRDRKRNIKGVFVVNPDCRVKGKTVVVIDDVMTTGATLNECAKVLKEAGAARVYVLTLAAVVK